MPKGSTRRVLLVLQLQGVLGVDEFQRQREADGLDCVSTRHLVGCVSFAPS